ncbi:nucleoside recognition domain-containing protein [Anoxybacter fermentans]|nr:nucleoside recognition domain-containing protein [Anoxybacter fermentans]
MNKIWLGLTVLGIIVGAINGKMEAVSQSILQAAIDSVEILLKLIGPMAFWLGIMKIAEKSGFTNLAAQLVRPLMRYLFPEVPPDHPAMGAMVMNFSANILGLGNSSTPLGIQAMKELQTLNPHPTRATKAMLTFLVINTSSITLLPGTMIGLRIAAGSREPVVIVGTTLFATTISTIAALLVDRVCRLTLKD